MLCYTEIEVRAFFRFEGNKTKVARAGLGQERIWLIRCNEH